MLNFIFFMNLPGTIFFLLHTCLIPLEKKVLPPHLRIMIVRLNLLLFLFPFPLLANYIRNLLSILHITIPLNTDYNKSITLLSDKEIIFPKISIFVIIILGIWCIGIFSKLLKTYFIDAKKFKNFCAARILTDSSAAKEIQKRQIEILRKNLVLSKNIQIITVDGLISPYVTGILHPKLYVPVSTKFSPQMNTLILRHELAHVKHHDLLYQRLSLITTILYWYNPILYFLFQRISNYDELSADETALLYSSMKERRDYGLCILEMLSTSCQTGTVSLQKSYASNKNFYKERIELMKSTAPKGKKGILLAAFTASVIFAVSLLPILVYAAPATITDQKSSLSDDSGEWLSFNYDEPNPEEIHFSEYDTYFIDVYGNKYPVVSETPYTLCKHNYVSGTISKHYPDGKGGCTVKKFEAKRCKYCASILTGDLIETRIYPKCPH